MSFPNEMSRKSCTRGRPPAHEAEERRQHLITVAAGLFLSKGYEATSLELIAKVAGASKTTIYRNFGDKTGLFSTVIKSFVEPLWPKLADVPVEGRKPAEVLTDIGHLMTSDSAFSDGTIAVLRLIHRESPRFPEIARIYTEIEQAPSAVVAAYLALARRKGILRIEDPVRSAHQFLQLIWGRLGTHMILGTTPLPDVEERHQVVVSAVDLFLNGVLERRPDDADMA